MNRTPGRDALAEAARLEMARIYSNSSPEFVHPAVIDRGRQVNVDELAARREHRRKYLAEHWQRRKQARAMSP